MKSLTSKKIIIAILSVLFAFCMFAGLTANKVSANTNLETVTLKTTMEQSAQMRLTNPTGMRFIINVEQEDVDKFNYDNVTVVTMITQKNLLDDANIDIADFNKDSAVKMAKVEFNKYNLEDAMSVHGSYKLTATILEISDANIAKNYVAKTYITDGEKIGYVEQATVASIYNVATEALKTVNPAEEPENYEVLLGYTKSCNIVINGNEEEPVEVPYGSKLIDTIFYGIPECYTVVSIKDANGGDVAKDFVVTEDIALTIELAENHVWKDGECALGCGAICYHPEYDGCTCKTCGHEKAHEYNATGLCSVCGVAENAVSFTKIDSDVTIEDTTFNGDKVQRMYNVSGAGWIQAPIDSEHRYFVVDVYVVSATNGWTGKMDTEKDSGVCLTWKAASGTLLTGNSKAFAPDGKLLSKRNDDRSGYYYIEFATWYTVVVDMNGYLPATGETSVLKFASCGTSGNTVDMYFRNARLVDSAINSGVTSATLVNSSSGKLISTFDNVNGFGYIWTMNSGASDWNTAAGFKFPLGAATISFDLCVTDSEAYVESTGKCGLSLNISPNEDNTKGTTVIKDVNGNTVEKNALLLGVTYKVTVTFTATTGTYGFIRMYHGNTSGATVVINNMTYTPETNSLFRVGVRNTAYASVTSELDVGKCRVYTWTVNNVEEGKTAHNYYSSMYIDFTPITAATVTFDITLIKQTGDDAFNFAINTTEDGTSGESLSKFTLSEGETKSITISITGSTKTFSRMFIYGGEGNTGGIVTISNLTYTPAA